MVPCAAQAVLRKRFNYSKINYLMLMMVDPAVHFHVIPRYEHPVSFCDNDYPDAGWPGTLREKPPSKIEREVERGTSPRREA